MTQKLVLWLDLEDTIITNWHDVLFTYHTQNIKQWILKYQPDSVHIFSAAIYDEADQRTFETTMKLDIEQALQCSIQSWPSMYEVQRIIYNYERVKYDSLFEFIQINGKTWSFVKMLMGRNIKDEHHVLIDDAVSKIEVNDTSRNNKFTLINVNELKPS